MNETNLMEYSREVMPLIRQLNKKKEILKDYKDGHEDVKLLQTRIKALQKELAETLEKDDDYKQINADVKEISVALKQALKSAAKASGFKAKNLKEYFQARAKEEAVKKTVEKAQRFTTFEKLIDPQA